MKKRLHILAFIASAMAVTAHAYDFSAVNPDGMTLYYNIKDGNAELTYAKRFRPTADYVGVVNIPASVNNKGTAYKVTGIGERAFAFCDAVTEIIIPSSVTSVGANAFDGCYLLSSVRVASGANLSSDGNSVYDNEAKSLLAYTPGAEGTCLVSDGTKTIADGAFGGCTFLNEVILPQSVETIGKSAFYYCNYLKELYLPENVSSIGHAALSDCLSLEKIEVAPGNTAYKSVDGVLFDASGTTLIQSPGSKPGLAAIPEGTVTLGEESFFRNYGVTTVKVPNTVKAIKEGAFIDCPRLSSVELAPSVKEIGALAFAMCPDLKSIYVAATNPSSIALGESVFADIDLDDCTLYVPQGSEAKFSAAKQWSDFKNIAGYKSLIPQTIEWEGGTDVLIGNESAQLVAHASSGLPVEFALAPAGQEIAVVYDNTITIYQDGTVMVYAYQPGDAVYAPAEPVACSFTLRPSGIIDDMISSDAVKVYGIQSAIIISGAESSAVATVSDISGRMIYQGTDRIIPVDRRGVYIVRVSGKGHKVITR